MFDVSLELYSKTELLGNITPYFDSACFSSLSLLVFINYNETQCKKNILSNYNLDHHTMSLSVA